MSTVTKCTEGSQHGAQEDDQPGQIGDVLDDMSWQQFEQLVGEAFRLKGYSVAETGGGCTVCGKPMVKRMAKRGSNAGVEFWGCTGYPSCRGTKPIV